MNNTHPTDLDLADLMLGDAAPEVQAHVEHCEHCQAALKGLRSFKRAMRDALAMPGDVPDAIRDSLPAQAPARVVSIWPKRAMLLAASLLAVAGVVVWTVQARRYRARVDEAKPVSWFFQADAKKEAPEAQAVAAKPAGESAVVEERLAAARKADKPAEFAAAMARDAESRIESGLRPADEKSEGLRRAKKALLGRPLAAGAEPAAPARAAGAALAQPKTGKAFGPARKDRVAEELAGKAKKFQAFAVAPAKPAAPRPAPKRRVRAMAEARKPEAAAALYMAKQKAPSRVEDINGDGQVDVVDAMMLARRIVSANAAPPRGDVDRNGAVHVRDAAAAPESEIRQARLVVDTGGKTLGAYQIVLTAPPQALAIVGIEGGAAKQFAGPPAYDRRGLKAGQIRLAAFSLDDQGPTGAVCVAKLRVALMKPDARKSLKVQPEVVASPTGAPVPAKVRVEWAEVRPAAAKPAKAEK